MDAEQFASIQILAILRLGCRQFHFPGHKSEGRNPKPVFPGPLSDFGFLSDFGLRIYSLSESKNARIPNEHGRNRLSILK
jgi:hypothetical protein